jgi:hypothetical protein
MVKLCGSNFSDFSLNMIANAKSRNAICNDGSDGGYYIRLGTTNTWIVHLQGILFQDRSNSILGGWWCWDNSTCASRWQSSPILMSSKYFTPTITPSGLFSTNSSENPDFYNANAVYIP